MLEELNQQLQAQQPEQQVEQQESPATSQAQEQKEYNYRMLREKAERAEQRAAELERQFALQQQRSQESAAEDEDFGISDDDYVDGKNLKKVVNKLKNEVRDTRKKLQEANEIRAVKDAEDQLRNRFSDFSEVLDPENVKRFAALYPREFNSITSHPDHYGRGLAAYNIIKNSGIIQKPNDETARLEANRSKPKSAATVSPSPADTPLTRVGDYDRRVLTEERRKQLYQEMRSAQGL